MKAVHKQPVVSPLAGVCVIGCLLSPAYGSELSKVMEEVTVTATKKAAGQSIQDVAIAMSAYGQEQLEILNVRDLKDLTYNMPNVALDEIGSKRGTANFSIRGLGINSSIPSVDPTVGVFVDGVYLGVTAGMVFDQFDLESIEVLRGPQGVLFGRNVIGGAVLVNTKDPTRELEGEVRAAVENGLNKYLTGSISGPLVEDKLLGKLAVYFNEDDGYFDNEANGNDNLGAWETTILRGGLSYLINDSATVTLKYENGQSDGDGPAGQNQALYPRDSFSVGIDTEGYYDIEWDMVSAEFNMQLGSGVLTNIAGWRQLDEYTLIDVDATPNNVFDVLTGLEQEQFSNELRYNFRPIETLDLTIGAYYFNQDMFMVDQRLIGGGATNITGGGTLDHTTMGLFVSGDWNLSETLTLIAGIRYTFEEKDAKVATLSTALPCVNRPVSCSTFDFADDENWSNLSPRIGLQWFPQENTQFYATYSRGFRSGGYNLRNTSPTLAPGPIDEEEQDAFEVGLKYQGLDNRVRLNLAAFYTTIADMQRVVQIQDEATGLIQATLNTADATIIGAEVELSYAFADSWLLEANVGVMEGEYDEVRFDLNQDGVVDANDEDLELPRLAPLSYGLALSWNRDIFGGDNLMARVSFSHRDEAYYSDNNLGLLDEADWLNANLTFSNASRSVEVSLFGRNLLDEVTRASETLLPESPAFGFTPGGPIPNFAPLNKGITYGMEARYRF
ncbi:TonB-dependent receptor [Pseudohaliea sp.]|uniref:TonB-dependent receptor n=1 Tax=Pseudohaliea sp. TaxID=2740289 RepID=UPI0032EC1E40